MMENYSNAFQTFAIGIIFLIIFYIIKRPRIGRIAANEPPFVPYTIPVLGHTYDYIFNTKKFIEGCIERYGECFSIYIFGRVMTIVAKESLREVFRKHQDFNNGITEFIPFHLIFKHIDSLDEILHINAKIAREEISGKFDIHTPMIRKYLLEAIDRLIGDCKEPKVIDNAWLTINKIVALPTSKVLIGEEAASHEDLVDSLENMASDLRKLVAIPPILGFIHPKLHLFAITLPLRFGWNPVSRHQEVVINRAKPVIEKRLKERKTLGNDYKPYHDALEAYMNMPDFEKRFIYYIEAFLMLNLGAIGTTSRMTSFALYDMAGRPECLNELYEEALAINKECNGSITFSDLQKMKKLDSFIKETLRHTNETLNLPHNVTSENYTFSNGYTIPKGRMTNLCLNDLLKSKEAYGDDAEEFKPFRFVNANSPATKVDYSYVIFGGGKHACPGRFFAVNQIKLILHELILRYDISTKSGKIEDKVIVGPITLPSRSALVFKNRK